MPLAPIGGDAERRNKPQHMENNMSAERLAIRIERTPLEGMEACNGLYLLTEQHESIRIDSAGSSLYVHLDMAKELADALYRYVGAIDGDKQRYEKARDTLGRRLRNGDIPGFEDARIRIETNGRG